MSIINRYGVIDYVKLITKLNNECLEKGWNLFSILVSLYLKRDIIIIREDLHNKITIINSRHDLCSELGVDISFSINRFIFKQCISNSEIFSVYNAMFDENEEDYELNSS